MTISLVQFFDIIAAVLVFAGLVETKDNKRLGWILYAIGHLIYVFIAYNKFLIGFMLLSGLLCLVGITFSLPIKNECKDNHQN